MAGSSTNCSCVKPLQKTVDIHRYADTQFSPTRCSRWARWVGRAGGGGVEWDVRHGSELDVRHGAEWDVYRAHHVPYTRGGLREGAWAMLIPGGGAG